MQRPGSSAAFTGHGGDAFGLLGDGIHRGEQVGSNVVAAGPVVVVVAKRAELLLDLCTA